MNIIWKRVRENLIAEKWRWIGSYPCQSSTDFTLVSLHIVTVSTDDHSLLDHLVWVVSHVSFICIEVMLSYMPRIFFSFPYFPHNFLHHELSCMDAELWKMLSCFHMSAPHHWWRFGAKSRVPHKHLCVTWCSTKHKMVQDALLSLLMYITHCMIRSDILQSILNNLTPGELYTTFLHWSFW